MMETRRDSYYTLEILSRVDIEPNRIVMAKTELFVGALVKRDSEILLVHSPSAINDARRFYESATNLGRVSVILCFRIPARKTK